MVNLVFSQPATNKSSEDAVKDENNECYLQRDSINEKDATRADYLNFQKDGTIHDDLFKEFVKSRKEDDITSTENEESNESLENSILKSNRELPPFMEETIPKLEDVIINSLEKAKNITESMKPLINNFEKNINKTLTANEETSSINKTSESSGSPFYLMIMNIKALFNMLTGMSRTLKKNV